VSDIKEISERIAALHEEKAKLEKELYKEFAEFGIKALPELRDKHGFTEDAAKLDVLIAEIRDKGAYEAALLEEKERREKEEEERILKLTCFSCHTVNIDDSVYCENCGVKLGEPPREYCKNCGTMNQPTLKYCGECGTKLDEA